MRRIIENSLEDLAYVIGHTGLLIDHKLRLYLNKISLKKFLQYLLIGSIIILLCLNY